MTATKVKRSCPTCELTGSWHYTDDLVPVAYRCPNYLSADAVKVAHALTEAANEAATKEARRIVADAARRFYEFSANQLRDEIAAAQLPGSVIGQAFIWASTPAASKDGPLIEHTERYVRSNEDTTRHKIGVWRSLVWHGRAAR